MSQELSGIALGRPGIPETEGIFVSNEDHLGDAYFFVRMGDGRRIDVWEVDVSGLPIEPNEEGWHVCLVPIEASRLKLVQVWETHPGRDPLPAPGEADPLISRRKGKRQGRRM
jgi:hypothetical protein